MAHICWSMMCMGKSRCACPVLGRTFTLRHTQKRFCIGPFDLKTYQSKACENSVELMPFSQYKDDMCPACREETGFNPAFYNADSISAQQRAYNLHAALRVHGVFLAAAFESGLRRKRAASSACSSRRARCGHFEAFRKRR